MKLDRYRLKAEASLTIFEFISEGPKGKIQKLIQFQETNREGLYNLSFGDKDLLTGGVDDFSISNNRDSEKVLATVVAALYAFFDKYPDAWVYATGSTKARIRLYRIGITKFYSEMVQDFELYGQTNLEWKEFEVGREYDAFLIQRKFL